MGKLYAGVLDGVVRELVSLPDDVSLAEAFPAGKELGCSDSFTACGPDVRPGWTYDGKGFAAPVSTPPSLQLRSVAAYALLMAIPEAQRDTYGSAVKGWDQRRMSARGSDLIPEDSPLIARIAPKISLTPKAWFDLALGAVAS